MDGGVDGRAADKTVVINYGKSVFLSEEIQNPRCEWESKVKVKMKVKVKVKMKMNGNAG